MTAGRYLLLDRVGVGGMAEVFRAKAVGIEGFEKIVAIKRIRPNLAADEQFVQMFVDEAKIAGQLRHENIVRIHELGMLQGTHFIAMEYVFGKDLLQLLARLRRQEQVMAPAMAAWIAANLLSGLHYAHTRFGPDGKPLALIHRDISPQNVLISYDGVVKLIDFGIAKATSRVFQTMGDVVKGKVGYMSPQQIMGEPIDHRSDVFATTTCLHEMLTCRRLFRGPSDIDVIDRVRNARVSPPSTINPRVPPELDAIVMRGLAQRPEDRYQSAAEMYDALMMYVATSDPPFGTPQLGFVMRSVFADEMETEWAHLNQLTSVQEAGVSVVSGAQIGGSDGFDGENTIVSEPGNLTHAFESGELSKLVSVERIIAATGVPAEAAEKSEPFLLVSHPPPEPSAPPQQEFMPGSTMAFPLTVQSGTFDLQDTSDDFNRPFHGAALLDGHATSPQIVPPGESIPDLPALAPPPEIAMARVPGTAPSLPPVPPRPEAGTPWMLLGLTALVAILLGAGGVLIALFAAGVLPMP